MLIAKGSTFPEYSFDSASGSLYSFNSDSAVTTTGALRALHTMIAVAALYGFIAELANSVAQKLLVPIGPMLGWPARTTRVAHWLKPLSILVTVAHGHVKMHDYVHGEKSQAPQRGEQECSKAPLSPPQPSPRSTSRP